MDIFINILIVILAFFFFFMYLSASVKAERIEAEKKRGCIKMKLEYEIHKGVREGNGIRWSLVAWTYYRDCAEEILTAMRTTYDDIFIICCKMEEIS